MSFVRPEVRGVLKRWAEPMAGASVAVLGTVWAFGSGGILGWVVAAGGVALALAGVQRARFSPGDGGPGVVDVTEGRIAYFGPIDGGVADLDTLEALTLDPTGTPAHWVLDLADRPPLFVPLTATGAEALFDAFAALPGLDTERLLREMRRRPDRPVVIWRREGVRDTALRLH